MAARHRGLVALAAVCLAILVLLCTGPGIARAEPDPTAADLRQALFRYERWVQTQRDVTYGWLRDYVWPMPLYYIGEMYHALYRMTGEQRYRAEVLRAADTAMRWGRQGLWYSYRGEERYTDQPAAILNALFIELLLDARELSGQPQYGAYAALTADRLRRTFFTGPLDADEQPQDYYMLTFYALAHYLDRTGEDDAALRLLGQRLAERGLSTLDASTLRWYYDRGEQAQGHYDGHSAYYQNVSTLFFLRHAARVRALYPALYTALVQLAPGLTDGALDGSQDTGTYFYGFGLPDYTESAGQVIWLGDLGQRLFGLDHRAIRVRASRTLLKRQTSDGAFYSNDIEDGPSVGYSDNAGWALANWLLGALPDLRPATATLFVPRAAQYLP